MDSIHSFPPINDSASHDPARFAGFKEKLDASTAILPANKIVLLKFINHMERKGITISRCRSLLDDMIWFGERIKKPWLECTRDDITELISELRRSKYAGWTQLRKAFALKTFYRRISEDDTFPKCVSWINRTELNIRTHELESRDILSRDDLKRLIMACESELESALIYSLWECGARSSEFIRLTIGDLEDKGNFYLVHIRTSKVRASSSGPRIRKFPLVESVGYLRAYLNKHLLRNDKNAPLWVSNSQNRLRQPLSDRGLRFILQRVAHRAKLGKRVWTHQFRHSAATRMAPKLSLPIMNDLMGWSKTSRMHATYVQLDGEASQSAVLELYGMETPQSKPKPVEMISCPACKAPNQPSNVMCTTCGRALQTIGAVSVMDELEQMKERMKLMELPSARGTINRAKRAHQRRMLRKKEREEANKSL